MELVSAVENYRRGAAFSKAERTHCRKGLHEWNSGSGTPQCPDCKKEREKRKWIKKRKTPPGVLHNVKYDQELVREVIGEIRAAQTTISAGARRIGCNANYLGRRVWNETKSAVLKRDKSCVMCGSTQNLDVHHRINRGAGGAAPAISFGMSNLITLCRKDHMWVTEHTVEAKDRGGWCLTRSDSPADCPVLYLGDWKLLTNDGEFIDV